jgi:hypothetical protein
MAVNEVADQLQPWRSKDLSECDRSGVAGADMYYPILSPRTVQTHLTHVYTKLGLTSRVQLVQEAAHHA